MEEKFLPIGSVVLLEGASKRLMIIGFCVTNKNGGDDKVYDYAGCLYPEGVISSEETALFNHERIKKVYFKGYSDYENDQFMERLKKALEEDKKEKPKIKEDTEILSTE